MPVHTVMVRKTKGKEKTRRKDFLFSCEYLEEQASEEAAILAKLM